jgi:hypothetical protein
MLAIFLSFPVDMIPGFGTSKSFDDIFTNQWNALKCLGGYVRRLLQSLARLYVCLTPFAMISHDRIYQMYVQQRCAIVLMHGGTWRYSY